jgi:hypothetical protein
MEPSYPHFSTLYDLHDFVQPRGRLEKPRREQASLKRRK